MSEDADILFEDRGHLGLITLNRPKAMNALTQGMCLALHERLDQWRDDENIHAVAIQGAGDKAFCAGGDVISLYESGQAFKDGDKTSNGWRLFFHDEYRMNAALHNFPKPYIALLDGITMGGGVGVSVHGSHRIATERTVLAMPETGIGLFPDVGGGYFMPRLPGEAGMYLALTGERIKAADCCYLGITQVCMPSSKIETLLNTLAGAANLDQYRVDEMIEDFASDPGPDTLARRSGKIDEIFGADSVEDIMKALQAETSGWAHEVLDRLKSKSPTAMKVTFRQLREGRKLNFADEISAEFRIANHTLQGHDFYEGVRAILIDKDNDPKWSPATLAEVSEQDVASHFEDLGPLELKF